jgi:hypothetical protein
MCLLATSSIISEQGSERQLARPILKSSFGHEEESLKQLSVKLSDPKNGVERLVSKKFEFRDCLSSDLTGYMVFVGAWLICFSLELSIFNSIYKY